MHNLVPSNGDRDSQIAQKAATGTGGDARGGTMGPSALQSEDPDAYVQLAKEALARQQFELAEQHVARALELKPDSGPAWTLKGELDERAGNDAEALGAYHRAVSCVGQNPEAALRLAAIQIEHSHATRSAQILRGVINCPAATDIQKSRAQWLLGVSYVRMARWEQAVAALDAGMPSRNMSADDWCLLAAARFRSGDIAGARRDVERQMQFHPEHDGLASLMADLNSTPAQRGEILPASNRSLPEESPAISVPQ